ITERRRTEAELARYREHLEDLVTTRTALLEKELARRREAERSLKQSEQLLRNVLDSLDAAVYVADMSSHEVLFANSYVSQRWGDLVGKICWQVLQQNQTGPCPFCTNALLLDSRGQPTGVHVWEFQNTVTGRWFQCRDIAIPWFDGRMVRLEIATDITELREAREAAISADRLKSVFLATMSHELRTPLNSIIGFTGVLLQGLAGPLNPEQTKQLGMVRESARHLLALINDVLDLSKIEAGQMEVERARFDMRLAIENCLRAVLPEAEKKGLLLTAAVSSDVGQIVSDRRRVEQILLNLLSNAIKFTEKGEVRIECETVENQIRTSVCDTGIGIRAEDVDKLFRPFQQLETGLSRRHEGTGLGLAICHNLVGLLGGKIWAESELGRGSRFTFTLPVFPPGGTNGAFPRH
ncbi:MAG: ATP-binding protein, partial [Kiritimatiellae bacterium]|nr:ATP-binding protein [Kiritimatiellia bacterium]